MKYLVSLYFDNETTQQIMQYIKAVFVATGNNYMIKHKVPPHITISSFETENIEAVLPKLETCLEKLDTGEIQWIGTGAFKTSTLYLVPVLNRYLQEAAEAVYAVISVDNNIKVSKYYQPFQWLPHTTIGKRMDAQQLLKAFQAVQPDYKVITGRVVKVGLAKANPYEDIYQYSIK